jgi:hypothetical protein
MHGGSSGVCLVASGALYLSGVSGGLLVASGKVGVRRGFSILEFPSGLRDTLTRGFWIIQMGQVVEVSGAKKQRYRGTGLHQISQGVHYFRPEYNI